MQNYNRLCPNCGDDLKVDEYRSLARCPFCGKRYIIDFDYDFLDGRWVDRNKLIEITTLLK